MTGHELRRIDEERLPSGKYRWRWVCSCRGTHSGGRGRWTYQSDDAARTAHKRHAERFTPGPKALRNLLKLKD